MTYMKLSTPGAPSTVVAPPGSWTHSTGEIPHDGPAPKTNMSMPSSGEGQAARFAWRTHGIARCEAGAIVVAACLHLYVASRRDVGQQLAEVHLVVADQAHQAADRD